MRPCILALALLICVSACAPANPGTSLPFEETFADARNGGALMFDNQAEIMIGGNQMRIHVKQPDSLAWSVAALRQFDNFSLDIDVQQLAGPADNDYGVIVRHVDDANFYRFEISGDGYFNVQKREKGQWKPLVPDWTPSPAIHQGAASNHLRVVAAGPTMTFYANQVPLARVDDGSFKRGSLGVFAGTLAEPGVQVAFSNLIVSR